MFLSLKKTYIGKFYVIRRLKVAMTTLSTANMRQQACPMTCPMEKVLAQTKTSSLAKS